MSRGFLSRGVMPPELPGPAPYTGPKVWVVNDWADRPPANTVPDYTVVGLPDNSTWVKESNGGDSAYASLAFLSPVESLPTTLDEQIFSNGSFARTSDGIVWKRTDLAWVRVATPDVADASLLPMPGADEDFDATLTCKAGDELYRWAGSAWGLLSGQAILVTDYADMADRFPDAPAFTLFRTEGGIVWAATGSSPQNTYQRLETPSISRPEDVPTCASYEFMATTCQLAIDGIGNARGDGSIGWVLGEVTATMPFDPAPWIARVGFVIPQGTLMWDGNYTRWAFEGNTVTWCRITSPDVPNWGSLPFPGDYETFADGDFFQKLRIKTTDTGNIYEWPAWD